ncbi:hypothetical protein B0H19DRAFT_1256530 [Mycena capillaripes]|nr:hypothetical protein B0H19DRAFT_1256530 [Mycena capillaripes]
MASNPGEPAEHSLIPSALLFRTRLAEMDAEIADLHARLQDHTLARKPIVEVLKSIISPVLTIPPKTTAEISRMTHDTDGDTQSYVLASVHRWPSAMYDNAAENPTPITAFSNAPTYAG